MKHDYSLAHLTVISLPPPKMVEVAARTGYRYVGLRMTRVTPEEVLYDLAHDRSLMKETKARLADTGIVVHDTELFRMGPALEADSFNPVIGGKPISPIPIASGRPYASHGCAISRSPSASS